MSYGIFSSFYFSTYANTSGVGTSGISGYESPNGYSGYGGWSGVSGKSGSYGAAIYMEFGAEPMNIVPALNRITALKPTLPSGVSGGVSGMAGAVRVWDAGAGAGSETIQVNFDKAHMEEYNWLYNNLWKDRKPFIFSPDNGTTKYLCVWEGGSGLVCNPYTGNMKRISLTVNMRILRTL